MHPAPTSSVGARRYYIRAHETVAAEMVRSHLSDEFGQRRHLGQAIANGWHQLDRCAAAAAQSATDYGEITISLIGSVECQSQWFVHRQQTPTLAAVEPCGDGTGFLAVEVVEWVDHPHVQKFTQPLQPTAVVCSDAIAALNIVSEHCQQEARVTPPQPAAQRLPVIHIVIDNFKRFLLGTPHSVSGNCLHEYICEFVYRFNHRLWQLQLPQRLLHATETVKVLPN